jgi:3'-(hydroxy)phthioceranyl-2'-palmitoyl(stearoyl)-2-O-sulfo-trehalose (hydroxy)phthioceranyltransferase
MGALTGIATAACVGLFLGGAVNKLLAGAVAVGLLGAAGALGTGVAAAEDPALVVSGTSPPVPWIAKRLYHFDPSTKTEIGAKYYDSADAAKQVIPYPGTVWPLTGLDSQKVGESVYEGTNNLDAAIRNTKGPMTVVGLSQGSEVMDEEQVRLAHDPTAPPPDQITFVKVSSPQHLLQRLFPSGTNLPIVDYTVPPQVDSQYNTVEVIAEYDIYGDPPDRFNPLVFANAVLGRDHSLAAFTDPASVPPQNVLVTTNGRGATTTTYLVPATELPLVSQLRKWGVPNPVADEMNVVLRPMVDRAYDRNVDPAAPPPPPVFANLPAIPAINVPTVNIPAIPAGIGPVGAPLAAIDPIGPSVVPAAARAVTNEVRSLLPKGKPRLTSAR